MIFCTGRYLAPLHTSWRFAIYDLFDNGYFPCLSNKNKIFKREKAQDEDASELFNWFFW